MATTHQAAGRVLTRQTVVRAAGHTVGRVLTRQIVVRAAGHTVGRASTRQTATRAAGQTARRVLTRQIVVRAASHTVGRVLTRQTTRRLRTRPIAAHHLRLTAILILTTTITACGWQLRGSYNLPPEITPIAVEGGAIADELRNSLRHSNSLAQSAGEPAASNVEILDENTGRRVLSVDFDGKVDEYEVRYEVRWQLTAKGTGDKSRRILIAPTTFRANRSYDYSASTVLSTNEQERELIENMRDDIAQRIVFRLQSVNVDDYEAESDDEADENDGENDGENDND